MEITLSEIDNLIQDASALCSSRERVFLESVRDYLADRGHVTPSQGNWIYSLKEKYSPERIAEESTWRANWNDTHRAVAIAVAHYYEQNPPYFGGVVRQVLDFQESFILSKKTWNKFCENKYAKRIRKEAEGEPKYKQSDCIQIRTSNRLDLANYSSDTGRSSQVPNALSNCVGFVLQVDAKPVTRAARGSRIYKILLAGESAPIFAHESDLKKIRRKKCLR